GIKDLINVNSADYKKSNMGQVRSKEIKLDILLNNYKLYKTPIVRNGKEATVGYKPEVWGIWD
ncbi:MAG: arsenate reductase family protein, partial [Clostridiaceae bacterium]